MSTKRRKGCEKTKADSHFTTVLDVRRARSDERVATAACKIRISPQFWRSDKHEVTRRLLREPQNLHFTTVLDVRRARSDERVVSRLGQPNPPCVKKKLKKIWRSFDPQPFSAQPFSADLLSTAILSRSSQHSHSQQIFSAIMLLWSGVGGQLLAVNYCLIRLLWSGVGGPLLSHHLLWSGVGGQLFSPSFAVVRGWWSAIFSSFAVVRGWWSAIVSSW